MRFSAWAPSHLNVFLVEDEDISDHRTVTWATQDSWLPKPREKAAEEANPVDTCIIDDQPLALWENKLLIKPLSLWSCIMAAIIHQGLSCCDETRYRNIFPKRSVGWG